MYTGILNALEMKAKCLAGNFWMSMARRGQSPWALESLSLHQDFLAQRAPLLQVPQSQHPQKNKKQNKNPAAKVSAEFCTCFYIRVLTKTFFVNEQAMSGGKKKGFWVLILFNKFHLILNVSINSTEGVEGFGVFVLFVCVSVCASLNPTLLSFRRRGCRAQETQSQFLSKLESAADTNKEWALGQLLSGAGEGQDRWSFPPQISVIYNRTWMTGKKWDAIWKLPYKTESAPKKRHSTRWERWRQTLKWILSECTKPCSL